MSNIYVGNLSFKATEDDLHDAFSEYGTVSKVNIIMDRETNRSRGFGFVEMPDAQEARGAIEGLNNQTIAGREITCNEARERSSSGSRDFGSGSRGGSHSSRDRYGSRG